MVERCCMSRRWVVDGFFENENENDIPKHTYILIYESSDELSSQTASQPFQPATITNRILICAKKTWPRSTNPIKKLTIQLTIPYRETHQSTNCERKVKEKKTNLQQRTTTHDRQNEQDGQTRLPIHRGLILHNAARRTLVRHLHLHRRLVS